MDWAHWLFQHIGQFPEAIAWHLWKWQWDPVSDHHRAKMIKSYHCLWHHKWQWCHEHLYSRMKWSCCYVNCDSNKWYFCANLSSGVLLVWDGDLACIGDMWKPNSLATPSWLWPRVLDSSYQLLRHWQSCVSSKQVGVDTCQLLRDNGRVLSRKGDSGIVLSSSSKKASRSRRLWSEWRNDQHIDWCRSRLSYIDGRSPL